MSVAITGMTPLLARRLAYALLLLAFLYYVVRVAPPDNGHEPSFLGLALGQGPARNPAIWAVFNLLGIVPLMYWALMFPDSRGQRVWAWPFALGLMAFGSFVLLPYLILRRPYPETVPGSSTLAARWFGGRPFAVCVGLALLFLLAIGIGRGDWADYARWFRASNFIHVMTVDFLLLIFLFPALLRDDMTRRHITDDTPLGRWTLGVPLLGPIVYLACRPTERAGSG